MDETVYHPYDYRYGFGIRKLARFDYEVKPGTFWTGNQKLEKQIALSAPTSAVKGLEYLLHWEKERKNGDEFTNKRLFVRHTGKYHIGKFEAREQGNVGFEYKSGEIRARLPIGKKFSISAGAIYRTHKQPYGYNPIEIWLNEEDADGNALNPWWTLGYQYGFIDIPYSSTVYNQDGTTTDMFAWLWENSQGEIVAYTDEEWVLKDVSFRVEPGESVAFVGPTGAGKSTIINLLNRFYVHQKGRILFDGKPIEAYPLQALRQHIGIVLQDVF